MHVRTEGGMHVHRITRPYELAIEASASTRTAVETLRLLGYQAASSSARLNLEPIERAAIVAVLTLKEN